MSAKYRKYTHTCCAFIKKLMNANGRELKLYVIDNFLMRFLGTDGTDIQSPRLRLSVIFQSSFIILKYRELCIVLCTLKKHVQRHSYFWKNSSKGRDFITRWKDQKECNQTTSLIEKRVLEHDTKWVHSKIPNIP